MASDVCTDLSKALTRDAGTLYRAYYSMLSSIRQPAVPTGLAVPGGPPLSLPPATRRARGSFPFPGSVGSADPGPSGPRSAPRLTLDEADAVSIDTPDPSFAQVPFTSSSLAAFLSHHVFGEEP